MAHTEEYTSRGEEIQQDIISGFSEFVSATGSIVLRREIDDTRQTTWLERGIVVALESHQERFTADEIQLMDMSPEDIIKAVADVTEISEAAITGQGRHRKLVLARHAAMYLTRRHSQLSYPNIGDAFGGRDHTTIIAAVKKVKDYMASDPYGTKNVSAKMIGIISDVERYIASNDYVKSRQTKIDVDLELLDAIAVTREGLHRYPTTQISTVQAKALRMQSSDSLVLDKDRRYVSDELLQTYGEIALSLITNNTPSFT